MTLDESIKREQMLTDSNYEMAESCHTDEGVYLKEEGAYRDRAEYHEQLAEWLRELKAYRKAEKEIEQELVNWGDIDNGKCRGLFLATSIIQHYKDEEVKADE